jgi:uncharacterized membrane protein
MDWMNFKSDGAPIPSLLRWIHVVAGIAWIGHLYFFNFVNANFAPTMDGDTKKKVIPELMPRALFWFRWGAAFTWITGILLLAMIFYHGKKTLEADVHWGPLQMAMLAVTLLGVFLYDVLVKTVLKTNVAAFWGGAVLVAAVLWGFWAAEYEFRGMQIHLGGLFGTIMAFNVWFRIWPAQKQIITAIKNGQKPEDATVALAGSRSRHNTFLSVPLVFLMLNVHNTGWASNAVFGTSYPTITLLMVLVGWALTQHLYGISKKVKGF